MTVTIHNHAWHRIHGVQFIVGDGPGALVGRSQESRQYVRFEHGRLDIEGPAFTPEVEEQLYRAFREAAV